MTLTVYTDEQHPHREQPDVQVAELHGSRKPGGLVGNSELGIARTLVELVHHRGMIRHLSLARRPGQARSTSRYSVLVGADRRGPQPVSRPRPEAAPERGLVLTPARTARCSLVTRRECLRSAHDHHRLRRIGSVAMSAGAQAYLGARTVGRSAT